MKLKKFFSEKDLDFLLKNIFGCEQPLALLKIARSTGRRFDFPLFQASIGQGSRPVSPSRHLITWFRHEKSRKERIVVGPPALLTEPLSNYYLGLWYAYRWSRPDDEMKEILNSMAEVGILNIDGSWAWIEINPRATFNLGVFYAIFGE